MDAEQDRDWVRLTLELHGGPGRDRVLSSRAPFNWPSGEFASGRTVGLLIADVLKFDDPAILGVEFRFLVLARAVLTACRAVPNLAEANLEDEVRQFIRAARELCEADERPAERIPDDSDEGDDDDGDDD